MKIQLVSWDVDGTLYAQAALRWELMRLYFAETWRGRWRETQRELHALQKFHRDFADRVGTNVEEMFAGLNRPAALALERKWFARGLTGVKPRPAAVARLNEFWKRGIRQVAISNFVCDYKVAALGLGSYFDQTFACEEIGALKPSPRPFVTVQGIYGVAPEAHLHIGDRADHDQAGIELAGGRFLQI